MTCRAVRAPEPLPRYRVTFRRAGVGFEITVPAEDTASASLLGWARLTQSGQVAEDWTWTGTERVGE